MFRMSSKYRGKVCLDSETMFCTNVLIIIATKESGILFCENGISPSVLAGTTASSVSYICQAQKPSQYNSCNSDDSKNHCVAVLLCIAILWSTIYIYILQLYIVQLSCITYIVTLAEKTSCVEVLRDFCSFISVYIMSYNTTICLFVYLVICSRRNIIIKCIYLFLSKCLNFLLACTALV